MTALWFDYVMFSLFSVSIPIYLILIFVMFKYRREKPFDSIFFKISFNLGILDMIHLVEDWTINKFAAFAWFDFHKLVLLWPTFFARLNTFTFWYTSLSQTLCVLAIAINRCMFLGFNFEWSNRIVRLVIGVIWVLPLLGTSPLLGFEYGYHTLNGSDGVNVYWKDTEKMWFYFNTCYIWCGVVGFLCLLCYGIAIYKLRTTPLHSHSRSNSELKLLVVGIVLFILQALCSLFCGLRSRATDKDALYRIVVYQNILLDVYSWCNAYLLLLCSDVCRKGFCAVLCRRRLVLRGTSTSVTRSMRASQYGTQEKEATAV